jgi:hypothetical protein
MSKRNRTRRILPTNLSISTEDGAILPQRSPAPVPALAVCGAAGAKLNF